MSAIAELLARSERNAPAFEMLLKIRTRAHQWMDGEQPKRNPKAALLRCHDRLKAIVSAKDPIPTFRRDPISVKPRYPD